MLLFMAVPQCKRQKWRSRLHHGIGPEDHIISVQEVPSVYPSKQDLPLIHLSYKVSVEQSGSGYCTVMCTRSVRGDDLFADTSLKQSTCSVERGRDQTTERELLCGGSNQKRAPQSEQHLSATLAKLTGLLLSTIKETQQTHAFIL